jgi:hypothetical protein
MVTPDGFFVLPLVDPKSQGLAHGGDTREPCALSLVIDHME